MRLIPICLALCLASGPAIAAEPDELAWMSGHWRSTEGETVSEEFWTDAAGGLMLGTNRTVRQGQAIAFEFLRIELGFESDAARYCALPGGRSATCFALVDQGENHVRFENSGHDFPQVIEYRREGDALSATISDLSGARSMDFSWQRVAE